MSFSKPCTARPRRSTLLFTFLSVFLLAFSSLHLSRHHNPAVAEEPIHSRHLSPAFVLFPDWQVLAISSASPDAPYFCLFRNITTPARFAGFLSSPNRTAFTCPIPDTLRRLPSLSPPVLTQTPRAEVLDVEGTMMRWKFLAYESLSTRDDVVVFVKGVNSRSGVNRPPDHFNCVFGDSVKTAVTSSVQEVFRCPHPNLTASGNSGVPAKISIEIKHANLVVPTVAYYTPPRMIEEDNPASLLCATTMVYNAAKFLKEWVMYHSSIGVEKFIIYDNASEDDLGRVVADLRSTGYDVVVVLWIWPKTQEAGFSHSVIYGRNSCKWMVYVDVDEFIHAPSWANASEPDPTMLTSLLPTGQSLRPVGQVSIPCNEFGPSGRVSHPEDGVTQGYDCRSRAERRHKSVVLLEAVERSLMNVIHHFGLEEGFRTRTVGTGTAVVNHYKYQAWGEFRNKFRRRVSAYVVDWTETVNPTSRDRAPGLGFEAVEPEGWSEMFCEVRDERLKVLCRRWFGAATPYGYTMAWE